MANIQSIRAGIESEIADYDRRIDLDKSEITATLASAEGEGRKNLTMAEDTRCEALFDSIERAKSARARKASALSRAREIEREEDESEKRLLDIRPTNAGMRSRGAARSYDQVVRIGHESRIYSRENDPEGKGTGFLTDVIAAYRGNPNANERLARHAREYEIDNKGRQTRAAGDVNTGALPNLIVPQYLIDEYAAKPSNARPFADICRQVPLPAEGMKVELAKGNTTSTAALQTSELVAAGGGNFDVDPLELSRSDCGSVAARLPSGN